MMLIEQVIELTEDRPHAIVYVLEVTWSLRRVRSRRWSLVEVLKLNIGKRGS